MTDEPVVWIDERTLTVRREAITEEKMNLMPPESEMRVSNILREARYEIVWFNVGTGPCQVTENDLSAICYSLDMSGELWRSRPTTERIPMSDVSQDITAMVEAMRDTLDSQGVELTRDLLQAAALSAFATLTCEGGPLAEDAIDLKVRQAICEFRGPDAEPPGWEPHRWVNACAHKLGEAALCAGLLLEASHADVRERFESQMVAVAAVAQEAILSRRAADARA